MNTFRIALLAAAVTAIVPALAMAQPEGRGDRGDRRPREEGQQAPAQQQAQPPQMVERPEPAPQARPQGDRPQPDRAQGDRGQGDRGQGDRGQGDRQRFDVRAQAQVDAGQPLRADQRQRFGDNQPRPDQVRGDQGRPDQARGQDRRGYAQGQPALQRGPDPDRRGYGNDRPDDRRGYDNRNQGFDNRGQGYARNDGRNDGRWEARGPGGRVGPDWRNDRRYDWRDYRNSNRNQFRIGRYAPPRGYAYGYRPFSIGWRIDPFFYASNYWIDDPYDYRLPPVWRSYRWVRYYNDVLLIDLSTGTVVDAIQGFFW